MSGSPEYLDALRTLDIFAEEMDHLDTQQRLMLIEQLDAEDQEFCRLEELTK